MRLNFFARCWIALFLAIGAYCSAFGAWNAAGACAFYAAGGVVMFWNDEREAAR